MCSSGVIFLDGTTKNMNFTILEQKCNVNKYTLRLVDLCTSLCTIAIGLCIALCPLDWSIKYLYLSECFLLVTSMIIVISSILDTVLKLFGVCPLNIALSCSHLPNFRSNMWQGNIFSLLPPWRVSKALESKVKIVFHNKFRSFITTTRWFGFCMKYTVGKMTGKLQ